MMVEINITLKDIEKYVAMLVVLNAVCPQVIENGGIMINLKENDDSDNVIKMPYEYFINVYDSFGLNEIAR